MSAYVVSDKTLSAIVKGFERYSTRLAGNFECEGYTPEYSMIIFGSSTRKKQGQALKNYNVEAVNIRYRENSEPTEFHFEDVEINEGIVVGCIDCFCYQACENPEFYESKLYRSLQGLKNCILERLIKEKGQEIEWGI